MGVVSAVVSSSDEECTWGEGEDNDVMDQFIPLDEQQQRCSE